MDLEQVVSIAMAVATVGTALLPRVRNIVRAVFRGNLSEASVIVRIPQPDQEHDTFEILSGEAARERIKGDPDHDRGGSV